MKREEESQEGEEPCRFQPSEAWIDAFDQQYSDALTELVNSYAARRVGGTRKGSTRDGYARELVLTALGDTLMGKARWDPDTKSLRDHLWDAIKRRTLADWERAGRFPQASIDTLPDRPSSIRDEAERTLRARGADTGGQEFAAETLAELRRCAARAPDVLALLDALQHEPTSRTEILVLTGFTPREYRAARRRLNRIVAALPLQLRPRRARPPKTTKENSHD